MPSTALTVLFLLCNFAILTQCRYEGCSASTVQLVWFWRFMQVRHPGLLSKQMLCTFCSPNQSGQEASASERRLVFAWMTGLPRIPSQGDMSIILQASHRVGVEMNAAQ